MRCRSGATDNRENARFCMQCGAPLGLACDRCGTALPPGARFCDACGAPVAGTATAPGPRTRAAPDSYTPAHLVREILCSRHALEGERKQVTVPGAAGRASHRIQEPPSP